MNYHKVNAFLSGLYGFTGTLKAFINRNDFTAPQVTDGTAGLYVSQSTMFLEHKLIFGVYVRNTFNSSNQATGVKRSIKLVMSEGKSNGAGGLSYSKGGSDNELYAELNTTDVSNLAHAIQVNLKSCHIESSGASLSLLNHNNSIKLSMSKGAKSLSVILTNEAIFELKANIAKYCILLHPELPADLSVKFLVESATISQGLSESDHVSSSRLELSADTSSNNSHQQAISKLKESLPRIKDIVTLDLVLGNLETTPTTEKTKKCLWAIGNQKWGKGEPGLMIIKSFQSEGGEDLCRQVVDCANKGDLSILNQIYDQIQDFGISDSKAY
jgi:hypothetical protein